MAPLTFPRTYPDTPVEGMTLTLRPMQELSPTRGGKQIAADMGPALWTGEWQTSGLTIEEWGILQAWIDTLSSLNDFYGYDIHREYPLAYPNGFTGLTVGGNPWDGTGDIVTVNANNVEIQLDELPVGFVLSPGDKLSFDYLGGAARALHRVVAGGTASAGGALTVEVRPHVRDGWLENQDVTFYRAAARMKVLPLSYDEQTEQSFFGRASFRAIQVL